ncbi:unnamed protein product [Meloidogyne enterolobii]|uniref:Uncharacterized protein n=2 Tax=Meloidogyne enterolobii TaxID=390850 RepID=A0A6V7Y880_MELEN|nr:unnamed protein product [Meloidogyne enterolobii]
MFFSVLILLFLNVLRLVPTSSTPTFFPSLESPIFMLTFFCLSTTLFELFPVFSSAPTFFNLLDFLIPSFTPTLFFLMSFRDRNFIPYHNTV